MNIRLARLVAGLMIICPFLFVSILVVNPAAGQPDPTPTQIRKSTPTATHKPTPTETRKPTPKATPTATHKPTATATRKPTATATRKPTATATRKPTATATRKPTATATRKPTGTPTATSTPTPTPTPTPAPLIVSDQQNSRVLEFRPPFSNGMNASVVIGQRNFTAGFPATGRNTLAFPWDAALDTSGNLYVVDGGNNRVLMFKPPFFSDMNASVVIGQSDFVSSDPATSQNGLSFPVGVAVDIPGNLYVAEESNNRVLEFKPPFTNGMNASVVIGQADYMSSRPATTQTGLFSPTGIAVDRFGVLYVADRDNSRVLVFKPPFKNGMDASVVIGQPRFTTFAHAATQTGLFNPLDVELDNAGNLYVADTENNRVLQFKRPFSNGMMASLVIGQPDFTSHIGDTSQSTVFFPAGLAFDRVGDLYVADNINSRVLEFQPPFSKGMNASVVIGQPDFVSNSPDTTREGLSGPVGLAVKEP